MFSHKNITKDFVINKSIPEPNTGCWIWTGASLKTGYGYFVRRKKGKLKQFAAHRGSYYAFYGKFDPLKLVCHKCDTPMCVNPNHLFLGTHFDNNIDCIKKGRSIASLRKNKTHCNAGHEYNIKNTQVCFSKGRTYRACRECKNISGKKNYAIKKGSPVNKYEKRRLNG